MPRLRNVSILWCQSTNPAPVHSAFYQHCSPSSPCMNGETIFKRQLEAELKDMSCHTETAHQVPSLIN